MASEYTNVKLFHFTGWQWLCLYMMNITGITLPSTLQLTFSMDRNLQATKQETRSCIKDKYNVPAFLYLVFFHRSTEQMCLHRYT